MLDQKKLQERREREVLLMARHKRQIEREEVKRLKRLERMALIFFCLTALIILPTAMLDAIELYSIITK